MNAAAGPPGEFEQLKLLLLQTETERLDSIEAKLDSLNDRVGTPEHLEAATGAVLANAFRHAEANTPRELVSAIAPSIISTIQAEIRNSRDSIIEAIYPISGRLVMVAVANAFKDLVVALQQQIDALISVNQWRWRVQSLMTGRPVSEIALASLDQLRVSRLFLIEKGSGRLLAGWSSEPVTSQNRDILSGMLAAIIDFSTQAFEGSGTLRTIDFGGREIALRTSARAIIAAECVGPLRSSDNGRIDEAFLGFIETMNDDKPVTDADLGNLAASIRPNSALKKKSQASRYILIGLATIIAASIIWFAGNASLRKYREHRVQSALNDAIGKQPILQAYPLRLEYDYDRRAVLLEGLLPLQADQTALTRAVADAASPYVLESHLSVVADPQQVTSLQTQIGNLTTEMSEIQSQNLKKLADLDNKIASLQSMLADAHAATSDKLAAAAGDVAKLKAILDGPAQRLTQYMSETAIFFGNGVEYLDSGTAEQSLNDLAALLSQNTLSIRIVGYSDESGTTDAKRQVGKRRAEAVAAALAERGIKPERLITVSRSASLPIEDSAGSSRPGNRRVVFERLFSTETR